MNPFKVLIVLTGIAIIAFSIYSQYTDFVPAQRIYEIAALLVMVMAWAIFAVGIVVVPLLLLRKLAKLLGFF